MADPTPEQMTVASAIKTAMTGKDNTSVDIGRVLWTLTALIYFALEFYSIVWHVPFDGMQYAQAAGLILVGGGVSLGAKMRCEPDGRRDDRDDRGDRHAGDGPGPGGR